MRYLKLTKSRLGRSANFALVACLIFSFCASLTPSIRAQAPLNAPPIKLSKYINVYVSVIDPKVVQDIFGKRIAQRFVAIQVTISNKNPNFQFLIHDVSLDLKEVFGPEFSDKREQEATKHCTDCTSSCMARTNPGVAESAADTKQRLAECRDNCGRVCTTSQLRYELSSLELSLIRGVAEKGQGEDKRNKIIRYFRAIGTIAAGAIGVASFGPSFAKSVAVFNGPVINATSELYPDYTINQMNRLSDSAYKSNTLVPKEQAKVLVAFIPQSIFLTAKQRQNFWNDPTSLYPENAGTTGKPVDFRNATAVVDGNFITEIDSLPPIVTGINIDPAQALEFIKPRPVVKGYILGQFLQNANLDLANGPEGMELTIDKTAPVEEGKIFFVIKSDRPVPRGTQLNFRVFNPQGAQTISQPASFMVPVPTLDTPNPALEGIAGGANVEVTLKGTNFMALVTRLVIDRPTTSGVKISGQGVKQLDDGSLVFKATLEMADSKEGSYKLRVMNNDTASNTIDFTVKPQPTPTPTPKP